MTDDQFDQITNQLANINQTLRQSLLWVVILLAAILGKLWGFPERLWSWWS
jgi:hypothetical protein